MAPGTLDIVKMKNLLCILFLVQFGFSARGELPQRATGEELDVTLCSVSRVSPEALESGFPGRELGLTFVFLISKTSEEEARFALKELKNFRISEQSYAELNDADTDSHTVINDVVDLRDELESLGIDIPARKSLVMTTTIVGKDLDLVGRLEVSPEFSWGGEIERFDFSISAK